MKKSILFIITTSLSLISCRTESSKEAELIVSTNDLTHTASCGDTINQVVDGLKQGVWVMLTSRDTVVYKNDTAYSVTAPMTSGEMIRELKSGFSGPFISYDSLVVNSH